MRTAALEIGGFNVDDFAVPVFFGGVMGFGVALPVGVLAVLQPLQGLGIDRLVRNDPEDEAGVTVDLIDSPAAGTSLAGYLTKASLGRPHVTLKLATSLDGCIALADGSSRWITGAIARAHVHSRRALADAILVGGGTWRSDKPALDVRLPGMESRSPDRIVLTRRTTADGATAIASPDAIASLDGVQYLYVEGGAGAAAAFLAADLVDRIELYRAPIFIGNGHASLGDIGLVSLDAAHGRWRQVEARQLGSDGFAAYDRTRRGG